MQRQVALYIGRFQPFHIGHLKALEWILNRHWVVIIAIGSAQYSHTLKNPFTVGERIEMIWRVLKARNLLDRCIICSIPDTNSQHAIWVSQVKAYSPKFDVAYTNDALSRTLFKEMNIPVNSIPLYNREDYSATKVRQLIAQGERWEHLVPKEVAEYIVEIGGDKRIKNLYKEGLLSS